MAIEIDNIESLRNEIMIYLAEAMDALSKEMSDDLGNIIQKKFYEAYSPANNVRTYQLIRESQHPEIQISRSTVKIKVFIDFNNMRHYRYDGTYIGTPTKNGYAFTEEELALSAARGIHGIERGTYANTRTAPFWEIFERKWTLQRVERRLKFYLRNLGLSVK